MFTACPACESVVPVTFFASELQCPFCFWQIPSPAVVASLPPLATWLDNLLKDWLCLV